MRTGPPPPSYAECSGHFDRGGGLYSRHHDDLNSFRSEPQSGTQPGSQRQHHTQDASYRWRDELDQLLAMGFGNPELLSTILDQTAGSIEHVIDQVNVLVGERASSTGSQRHGKRQEAVRQTLSWLGPEVRDFGKFIFTRVVSCWEPHIFGIILFVIIFGIRPFLWAGMGLYAIKEARKPVFERPCNPFRRFGHLSGKLAAPALVIATAIGCKSLFWSAAAIGVAYGASHVAFPKSTDRSVPPGASSNCCR